MLYFEVITQTGPVDCSIDTVSASLLANTFGESAESFGAEVAIQGWLQSQVDEARVDLSIEEQREHLRAQVVRRIADPELLDNLTFDQPVPETLWLLAGGGA